MSPAPTHVRHRILAVSMAMAFVLYLDRICIAEIVKSTAFRRATDLSPPQVGYVLGAFFFAYAIFQVPAGWLADRFGARATLGVDIVLWSIATAITGTVTAFPALVAARVLCAAGESGAYPASGSVIRRWFPLTHRARANSTILLGGRIGAALAPAITAYLVAGFGSWRPPLWLDGSVGLIIAALYVTIVRDRPAEHPACNAEERRLIGGDAEPERARLSGRDLRQAASNPGLWLIAVVLLLMNVGSTFLITWLPSFLKDTERVRDLAGGRMVTLVLAVGMVGTVAGGWAGDRYVQAFGLKRGRRIGFVVPALLAGFAYAVCFKAAGAWETVVCCAVASFASDMAYPAVWGFLQDIGGARPAAVFGWANMWANWGAALVSVAAPWLMTAPAGAGGNRAVFGVAAAAFLGAGALALKLDPTRPIGSVAARAPAVSSRGGG
jgi:MFS family permease